MIRIDGSMGEGGGQILRSALPLALTGESRVEIRGGTHVPWSPTADYLERQWGPWLEKLGLRIRPRLKRAGFYPAGGGELQAEIEPAENVLPLRTPTRRDAENVEKDD